MTPQCWHTRSYMGKAAGDTHRVLHRGQLRTSTAYIQATPPPPACSARSRSVQACSRLFSSARPWARASCFRRWQCHRPWAIVFAADSTPLLGGKWQSRYVAARSAEAEAAQALPRLRRRPAGGARRARRRGRARRALQRRPRLLRARDGAWRPRRPGCTARRACPRWPCRCR